MTPVKKTPTWCVCITNYHYIYIYYDFKRKINLFAKQNFSWYFFHLGYIQLVLSILQVWFYSQVYLGYTQLVTDHFAESQLSRSDAVFLWQKYFIEERRKFPNNHEKEREMKVFKILTPFSWQTAVTLPSQGSRSYQSWLGRANGSLSKVLRASYI